MKKDLGKLPAIFPMPVLLIATYDEKGKVDVMNAAWGQVCDMDKIVLFLTESHKTVKNIKLNKAFTVALVNKEHVAEADYFGIDSGNNVLDKFERTGLKASKSSRVNAPIIEEFPLTMECEVAKFIEDDEVGFAVVGRIVNVIAEDSVLDEKGKVDASKLGALTFDQFKNGYYEVGQKVAQAWNAGLKYKKK
ncbi:MAG: flavin reductase family protein [Bacilli bacterium]|nr:flavin reductase family protein [Bacilli bacterium]